VWHCRYEGMSEDPWYQRFFKPRHAPLEATFVARDKHGAELHEAFLECLDSHKQHVLYGESRPKAPLSRSSITGCWKDQQHRSPSDLLQHGGCIYQPADDEWMLLVDFLNAATWAVCLPICYIKKSVSPLFLGTILAVVPDILYGKPVDQF
jgi:hypothetical protein